MITLYTQTTPNGRKPMILMEELGAAYDRRFVDLAKAEQKSPEFLKLNPNGKIPVLIDEDGPESGRHVIFESGAILIYLADKFASPLWPSAPAARSEVLQWLMFQMASVGPMIGQLGHFRNASEPQPYAASRFQEEGNRILGVLEMRLADAQYLGGGYSIADIATYPWVIGGVNFIGLDLAPFPHLTRWLDAVGTRPAVIRAMTVES